MTKPLIVCCLAISTLLGACHPFQTPEIREPKKITIQVERWAGTNAIVRINAHCYNQNSLGFTYKGGTLDLTMENHPIGHAVVDTTFDVAAHSAFTVPIEFPLDVPALGKYNLDLSKEVRIEVDGKMNGTSHGISKTLDIHYDAMHLIDLKMNYPVDGH